MNCSEIQEQLSAFHDDELTNDMREAVAAHVANCEACASQFAEFESYTHLFNQLPQPDVPPAIWAGIARELERDTVEPSVESSPNAALRAKPGQRTNRRSWLTIGRLAVAASVMLVLGLGFWMARNSNHSESHHDEFAMTMDRYLKTLASDPDQAERFLLNKYDGQIVDPQDAVRLVGYRPAVASGLPDDYMLASTSIVKMPCCTCVKAVCKRRDGSTLVLFEHDDEAAEWFGGRPSSTATCGEHECCLVDLDASIAATWKRGPRWVTAVGVRDTAEVGELVTWLENKHNSESTPL